MSPLLFGSSSVYAVTRVRARKPRLLQPDDYVRMLQMDGHLLAKNIGDIGYQQELNELHGKVPEYELMERALLLNMARDFTQVQGFCGIPMKDKIEAYLGRVDVRNIVSLVRHIEMHEGKSSLARVIIPYRSWAGDATVSLVASQSSLQALDALSEGYWFSTVLEQASEAFKSGGLGHFEDELMKGYYAYVLRTLSKDDLADRNLRMYVKHEIDILNALTAVKFCQRNVDADKLASRTHIPDGVEIDRPMLKELLASSTPGDLKAKLVQLDTFDDYGDLFAPEMDAVRLYTTVSSVRVRLAKHFSFIHPLTILPIIHYLVSKEQEVENLRILVRGKERGLPSAEIESLMVVAR